MDKYEIRKAALAKLAKNLGRGGIAAISKKSGIDASYVSRMLYPMEKKGAKNIGEDVAEKIAEAFPEWLAGGITSMRADVQNVSEAPTDEDFSLVPQLDVSASCGAGYFVDHVVVKGGLAFKKSSLRDFGVPESSARIIYASGGSMEPSIQDGCVVLINISDREPREGKIYAICQPDGSLVLKRLVHDYIPAISAQGWVMRSDNPNKTLYPDKMLPPDSRTSIVGRAVWNDNRL